LAKQQRGLAQLGVEDAGHANKLLLALDTRLELIADRIEGGHLRTDEVEQEPALVGQLQATLVAMEQCRFQVELQRLDLLPDGSAVEPEGRTCRGEAPQARHLSECAVMLWPDGFVVAARHPLIL